MNHPNTLITLIKNLTPWHEKTVILTGYSFVFWQGAHRVQVRGDTLAGKIRSVDGVDQVFVVVGFDPMAIYIKGDFDGAMAQLP